MWGICRVALPNQDTRTAIRLYSSLYLYQSTEHYFRILKRKSPGFSQGTLVALAQETLRLSA
jgi:hypothetical protein